MTNSDTIPGGRREGETVGTWATRVWSLGYVPANGGTEQPFTDRNGRRLLYCVDLKTRQTAYIDLATDLPTEPAL